MARQARKKLSKLKKKRKARKNTIETAKQTEWVEDAKRALQRDAWLSSFGKVVEGERKSFLNIELDEYLELLDWTGRQIKEGKRGKIPPHLANILERLARTSHQNLVFWRQLAKEVGRGPRADRLPKHSRAYSSKSIVRRPPPDVAKKQIGRFVNL